VFFIPLRVVAENPARRISTCRLTRSRRLGGAAAAGRTMVMSPAAPDSFSVIFRFGADDGARAIGATDDAAAVELMSTASTARIESRVDWGALTSSVAFTRARGRPSSIVR
jgi:hypothetical protein